LRILDLAELNGLIPAGRVKLVNLIRSWGRIAAACGAESPRAKDPKGQCLEAATQASATVPTGYAKVGEQLLGAESFLNWIKYLCAESLVQ
jgi:hypothetical protein